MIDTALSLFMQAIPVLTLIGALGAVFLAEVFFN